MESMSHHLVKTRSSEWELTTAFTKGRGLATATEMWLQKWFCVLSVFTANNVLWSNVGELSWSWILKNNIIIQVQKEKKISSWPFHILLKTGSYSFSCRCCAVMAKKCTKKCAACAMLFFLLIEPTDVLTFWLPLLSSNPN